MTSLRDASRKTTSAPVPQRKKRGMGAGALIKKKKKNLAAHIGARLIGRSKVTGAY